MATGQLENTARISQVRKSIARMKTVIRERELANKIIVGGKHELREMSRKVYVGKVVSDKMDKTITVLVETYKNILYTVNV